MYGQNNAGYGGYFAGNLAYTGTLSHVSDARLKKEVKTLEGALDQLLMLRGVTFTWKDPEMHGGATARQIGFIAQEVETVFPEWVGKDASGTKTLSTDGLGAVLVESLRTLKTDNDSLEARAAILEDRIKSLEAGRRPLVSGFGEGGIGVGMLAIAGAILLAARRKVAASRP